MVQQQSHFRPSLDPSLVAFQLYNSSKNAGKKCSAQDWRSGDTKGRESKRMPGSKNKGERLRECRLENSIVIRTLIRILMMMTTMPACGALENTRDKARSGQRSEGRRNDEPQTRKKGMEDRENSCPFWQALNRSTLVFTGLHTVQSVGKGIMIMIILRPRNSKGWEAGGS